VTRDPRKAASYLEHLGLELALASDFFRADRRVERMHWGGGTPTYYGLEQLGALYGTIRRRFELSHDGEYSIEVDPRTVSSETIEALRATGFNRVSFGVQDFDPVVQAAVHRVQSPESTLATIAAARRSRFDSVNVDLMYGLPLQTVEGFSRTLETVISARPDRIALYSYAHLPSRFKPQRRIRAEDLPAPATRLRLLGLAIELLGAAGYDYIGMDHFALPGDALAVAQRQGRLRRDFQGYSSGPPCDLVGVGASAIGQVGATYSQNHRELRDYQESLARGCLPVMRGLELSADDLVRRSVIQALICDFAVCKMRVELAYLIDFDRYFAAELRALRDYEELGLLVCERDWITVTARGRFLIRAICMVFDRYLQRTGSGPLFSRVI
jgi:oxygen-independent coproporphyrinogen-3 oxidase